MLEKRARKKSITYALIKLTQKAQKHEFLWLKVYH